MCIFCNCLSHSGDISCNCLFDAQENKEYLAIEGLDGFRKATVDLLLGPTHPAIKEVGGQGEGC